MLDLLIIGIYFLSILMIGFSSFKHVQTLRQFATFDKNMHFSVLAIALFCSLIDSITVFGYTDFLISAALMFFIIFLICEPLSFLFITKFVTSRIQRFKGMITVGDIMESFYGSSAKIITGILSLILSVSYITAQLSFIGIMCSYLFNIEPVISISLSSIIVATYVSLGGIKAIIKANKLHFILIILFLILLCNLSFIDLNDFSFFSNLKASDIHILPNNDKIWYLLCLSIIYLIPFLDPVITQRMLIAKDSNSLNKSVYLHIIMSLVFFLIFTSIIVTAFIIDPSQLPETILLNLIDNNLYVGAKGLVVIGLLGIVISTIDAYLNIAAVSFVNDIIFPIKKNIFNITLSDSKKLNMTRILIFIIMFGTVLLSLTIDSVPNLIFASFNFWAAIIVPPLFAGIFGFKAHIKIFTLAALSGLIVVLIDNYYFSEHSIFILDSVIFGMIANGTVLFLVYAYEKYFNPKLSYSLYSNR